jgi:hypothetical protein
LCVGVKRIVTSDEALIDSRKKVWRGRAKAREKEKSERRKVKTHDL